MCRPTPTHAVSIVAGALIVALVAQGGAQSSRAFRARLSLVPVDLPMLATVAGSGTVTATLTGNRLAITGSFEGLKSEATSVKLHRGIRGVRGPAVVDLAAPTHGTSGQFAATIELSASQVDDLGRERLYVQLSSEKSPDGNLWGWLLPQENKR